MAWIPLNFRGFQLMSLDLFLHIRLNLRGPNGMEWSLPALNGASELLKGLRVLLVEDEALVALLIEQHLSELGCTLAGSARSIAKAMELLDREKVEAAILDMNVAGKSSEPVAERLDTLGIPFLFASGYGAGGLGSRWGGYPVLQKPFSLDELKAMLLACLRSPS